MRHRTLYFYEQVLELEDRLLLTPTPEEIRRGEETFDEYVRNWEQGEEGSHGKKAKPKDTDD